MISGLNYTVLIITFVCVDERLQKTWMVVSVLVTCFAEILKRFLSIVKSDHSNCSHQVQLITSERLQVQKENALTERVRLQASTSLSAKNVTSTETTILSFLQSFVYTTNVIIKTA